jgi:hypothetical protein
VRGCSRAGSSSPSGLTFADRLLGYAWVRVLYCVECGCCSGELGRGWVAMRCGDPDDPDEAPAVALYCPPCASAEFGYRPDVAARYVCAWEPLADLVDDRS